MSSSSSVTSSKITDKCRGVSQQKVSTYIFTAPVEGQVTFNAICGNSTVMTAAPKLVITAEDEHDHKHRRSLEECGDEKTKSEANRIYITAAIIFISFISAIMIA